MVRCCTTQLNDWWGFGKCTGVQLPSLSSKIFILFRNLKWGLYFIAKMSHMTEGELLQNLGVDAKSIQAEDNARYLHHSNFVKISAPLLNYSIRAYPKIFILVWSWSLCLLLMLWPYQPHFFCIGNACNEFTHVHLLQWRQTSVW